MPTAGRNNTSDNNQWNENTGSNNQIGSLFVMPATGLITTLHVYVSGVGSTVRGRLALWDSSGNVLGQTGDITLANGGTGINGQAWASGDLLTPQVVSNGASIYIGFWRLASGTVAYSWANSGGGFGGVIRPAPSGSVGNVSGVTNLSIGTGTTGQLSAYADYVQGGLGWASGGSFSKYALKRWNATASAWQRHALKRWNATSGQWEWLA